MKWSDKFSCFYYLLQIVYNLGKYCFVRFSRSLSFILYHLLHLPYVKPLLLESLLFLRQDQLKILVFFSSTYAGFYLKSDIYLHPVELLSCCNISSHINIKVSI